MPQCRLNIKMPSCKYRDSHYKDNTILWLSHLHNGNFYTWKDDLYIESGARFTKDFPSKFKFDGNFVSLSPRFSYSDRYKILYMARQLCCRGMWKKLLRSVGQQWSYGKGKFPSNLNCGQKNVSETGPMSRSWARQTTCPHHYYRNHRLTHCLLVMPHRFR